MAAFYFRPMNQARTVAWFTATGTETTPLGVRILGTIEDEFGATTNIRFYPGEFHKTVADLDPELEIIGYD